MKISAPENGSKGGPNVNYQTNEQLSELRLNAMKMEYQRQAELPAISELTFDERFSMIVTAQINARRDAKMKRLIRAADLREPGANLSSIDYDPVRNLSRKEVAALSDCEWIRRGNNLIITGATGVGKTYLMSAFGREACTRGFTVRTFRVSRMLTDLKIGFGDGSYNQIIASLIKPDLLILDDFGLKRFDVALGQDFKEVIEERSRAHRSTGITAQLPVKEWPSTFDDLTIADGVMDRIVPNAYRFNLKGPSRRPSLEAEHTAHTRSDPSANTDAI